MHVLLRIALANAYGRRQHIGTPASPHFATRQSNSAGDDWDHHYDEDSGKPYFSHHLTVAGRSFGICLPMAVVLVLEMVVTVATVKVELTVVTMLAMTAV